MSFLTPFRERLWHMFSPGEPSPPSPETPEPQTEQLHKVRKESVAQQPARRKSLSPIVKRVKRVEEDPIFSYDEDNPDDSDESLSGSEADADDESQSVSEEDEDEDGKPKPKRLKRSKDFTADSDHESEEEVEEQAADITAEEKDEYGIGVTIEPVAHATLGDLGYEGWTQDELNLYNRLNDRGVVPLLHTSWRDDFPTIPEVLFTTDPDEAYIKNELGTEFRGSRALSSLLETGVRARDMVFAADKTPAPLIARIIKAYITWSLRDAGLDVKATIPLISVMAAPQREPIQKTVTRMTTELQALAAQWRQIWTEARNNPASFAKKTKPVNGTPGPTGGKRKRESATPTRKPKPARELSSIAEEPLPTLYGIVLARTIMAFVTYDAALEDSKVRSLALFNWRDRGQDVWNSLAVALMVVQAREVLVGLGPYAQVERSSSGTDPDA